MGEHHESLSRVCASVGVILLLTACSSGTISRSGVSSGVSASPPATPTGVDAKPFSHHDPPGDVFISTDHRFDEGQTKERPAPHQVNGDITDVVFLHGASQVRIIVTFVDLSRAHRWAGRFHRTNALYSFRVDVFLRTNEGLGREVTFDYWARRNRTEMIAIDSNGAGQERVHCPGVEPSADYRRNVVTMGIPRSCLGQPRWVRIWLYSSAAIDDKFHTITVDWALNDGLGRTRSRLSPRLEWSG
jgi:hypothetical protein